MPTKFSHHPASVGGITYKTLIHFINLFSEFQPKFFIDFYSTFFVDFTEFYTNFSLKFLYFLLYERYLWLLVIFFFRCVLSWGQYFFGRLARLPFPDFISWFFINFLFIPGTRIFYCKLKSSFNGSFVIYSKNLASFWTT